MKCRASISLYEKPKMLYECFLPEINKIKKAELRLRKEKDHLRIDIEAKDPVSLRAMFNSVMKGVTIFEKMRTV